MYRKFLAILLTVAALLPVAATAAEQGKTEVGGYIDFVFFDDRGRGWTGNETSFTSRIKVDIKHHLYNDIELRARGMYVPTVGDHSRGIAYTKKQEGYLEDTYINFKGVLGKESSLKFGVVKVPFGIFDTVATEARNRPYMMGRYREWDYGMRFDYRYKPVDVSLAIVNGEGVNGTDANSSKSVALRIAFHNMDKPVYNEEQTIVGKMNPIKLNPSGGFKWQFGMSGYVGNRYTTPIKEKNNHYSGDITIEYSRFTLRYMASYFEGYFTDKGLTQADFNTFTLFGPAVKFDIDNQPKALGNFVELVTAFTDKTSFSAMYEMYDPDMDRGDSVKRAAKERMVFGIKHDIREKVSFGAFYTINNNPAFGKVGNPVEQDSWKGDNVIMLVIAAEF